MSEVFLGRPAEPVETIPESSPYGGFAKIAQRLNALHPERSLPISRQLVHKWWQHRETNEFPEARVVEIDGKPTSAFDLAAVERWHEWWLRKRRVNPPIHTIPLFDVDHRGHPVDTEQSAYRGHPVAESRYRESILDL